MNYTLSNHRMAVSSRRYGAPEKCAAEKSTMARLPSPVVEAPYDSIPTPRPGEADGVVLFAGWADCTDEELLLAYRDTEDRQAFAELVHRYERELFTYLRRYLGNSEMAEDAFQAAFLQVHLKCEQFEEGRRFRPWLYTIATNQAIDAQRRNRRHCMASLDHPSASSASSHDEMGKMADLLVSDDPDPLVELNAKELRESMKEVLLELPDHMQMVVHLVYYQGLKYREAAEVLDVPVGTVKSRLHAAIARLSEAWKTTHPPQNF